MATRKNTPEKNYNIPRLFLNGGKELGLATGFTDPHVHERWRKEGLPFYICGKNFYYRVSDVEKFLTQDKYKAQMVDFSLLNRHTMRTQKRTFLGIDITRRKSLYTEIDALTEENREQAEEIGRLETDLTDKNITVQRLNAKAADLEEKYNAAVKYQQNTQAAYDELKEKYDSLIEAHNACIKKIAKKREDEIAEADAVPTGCETAKTIGAKDAQSRGKNGRFEKKQKR